MFSASLSVGSTIQDRSRVMSARRSLREGELYPRHMHLRSAPSMHLLRQVGVWASAGPAQNAASATSRGTVLPRFPNCLEFHGLVVGEVDREVRDRRLYQERP